MNSSASIPPFSLQPKVGSRYDPSIQRNLDGTVAAIDVEILFDSSFPVDLTWKWGGNATPVAVLPNEPVQVFDALLAAFPVRAPVGS
jgi:hypothetical protein